MEREEDVASCTKQGVGRGGPAGPPQSSCLLWWRPTRDMARSVLRAECSRGARVRCLGRLPGGAGRFCAKRPEARGRGERPGRPWGAGAETPALWGEETARWSRAAASGGLDARVPTKPACGLCHAANTARRWRRKCRFA